MLPDPRRLASRRTSGSGGGAPGRHRPQHGSLLRSQLSLIAKGPRRIDIGVDPDLVFKIRAASRPADSAFEGRGLEILGETVGFTYFVLSEDEGRALSTAIERYASAGDQRSFFDAVDGIEPYGPDDRQGPGLENLNWGSGSVIVDISVWPSDDYSEAVRRMKVVESVLSVDGASTVLLRSTSARRNFLRVQVGESALRDLLETSVVELVRTPPVPFLDFREWWNASSQDLTVSAQPSAVVGVLDDAPMEDHPLLSGLVLSVDSIAPHSYQWQQRGNHGTEVVGRVLYPYLHEELRDMSPLSAVGSVRVARILEPDPTRPDSPPRFATFDFPHEIVAKAIRHLHDVHNVKIFNLSIGYAEPFNDVHVGPLTEVIDDLVRELDIVVVVPTGNSPVSLAGITASGHHVVGDKPHYFFTPEQRLSEPGPAALAITVASVALSGAAAEMPNRVGWQAVSTEEEISPFSRTGPGLGTTAKRMNKPDFAHYGGNLVLNDSGHAVFDPGAGVVTPSFRTGEGRLFASVNGTSFAVPAVARVAADIAHAYPEASANLIRALVATGATHGPPAASIAQAHDRAALYGYGRPSTVPATESGPTRVTMTYDGRMPIDAVQIHPLPVPELFRRGSGGERTITVAVAFDPPVRRQRREYLASSVKVAIYRDIDLEELSEMLIRQDPDDSHDLIDDRRKLDLLPGSNSFANSTLQVRRWRARQSFINDDETFLLAVTHKAQTWARDTPGYTEQPYALAVTLEDRYLAEANLRELLTQQVRVPARARIRP